MKQEHLEIINKFIGDFQYEMIDEKWVDYNFKSQFPIKVSNYGRIAHFIKKRNRWEIKKYSNVLGYLMTTINRKMHKVHRIVAMHFIDNPKNKPQVNHKNLNKKDNRVDNLEWNTSFENNLHARNMGVNDLRGVRNVKRSMIWNIINGTNWKHI